jgi:hypothetical protein
MGGNGLKSRRSAPSQPNRALSRHLWRDALAK